jgi:hypothetical protein
VHLHPGLYLAGPPIILVRSRKIYPHFEIRVLVLYEFLRGFVCTRVDIAPNPTTSAVLNTLLVSRAVQAPGRVVKSLQSPVDELWATV